MYFYLMLGRVMLTCDSFALVGWTSTPKGMPKGGLKSIEPQLGSTFICLITH